MRNNKKYYIKKKASQPIKSEDSNRKYYRQIALYTLFFVIVFTIGAFVKKDIKHNNDLLEKHGVDGIAVVTKRYYVKNFHAQYKFKFKNKTYKGSCSKMLSVGDTIDIVFYPKDPSINKIKRR